MDSQKATETLMAQVRVVEVRQVDGETVSYRIPTFSLAKTIRAFQYLTDLGTAAGLSSVASDIVAEASEGNPEPVAPAFVLRALAALPKALKSGVPALYRLVGLVVTSNRQLEDWETEGVDIEDELHKAGRKIANRSELPGVIELVTAGADALGVQSIAAQFPKIRALLS